MNHSVHICCTILDRPIAKLLHQKKVFVAFKKCCKMLFAVFQCVLRVLMLSLREEIWQHFFTVAKVTFCRVFQIFVMSKKRCKKCCKMPSFATFTCCKGHFSQRFLNVASDFWQYLKNVRKVAFATFFFFFLPLLQIHSSSSFFFFPFFLQQFM